MQMLQNTAKTNTTDMLSLHCLIFKQHKLLYIQCIYKKAKFCQITTNFDTFWPTTEVEIELLNTHIIFQIIPVV